MAASKSNKQPTMTNSPQEETASEEPVTANSTNEEQAPVNRSEDPAPSTGSKSGYTTVNGNYIEDR